MPAPDRMQTEMHQLRKLCEGLIAANVALSRKPASPIEERLERQKASIIRQIDTTVYQLYGLSNRDIALVEDSV